MELKDLVGEHQLDAVDFESEGVAPEYEDCQVIRFRLNGVVYRVIEDPEDGYRSAMRKIEVATGATMRNRFVPVRVRAVYKTRDKHETECDILELFNASTGRLVLEVGTEDVEDYYPCFVASFHLDGIPT